MYKIIILVICFFTLNTLDAQYLLDKEPEIRVQIIHSLKEVEIHFNDNWTLTDSKGITNKLFVSNDSIKIILGENSFDLFTDNEQIESTSDYIVLHALDPAATLTIKDVPYGIGWWWEGTESRIYAGEVEIRRNANKNLEVVVVLPLEKYLCGVIPYEIGKDAPLEALKAQAVAARSDVVEAYISGKYRGDTFDICADVECQVFAGNNRRTAKSDQAVKETRGLCLFDGDKVISAYYASNCGGISERIENVWPERSGSQKYWGSYLDSDSGNEFHIKNEEELKEWINSSPHVYCNPQFSKELPEFSKRNFRWQVEMTNNELSKNLNRIKEIGDLQSIIPTKRGPSGRMIKATFIGTKDSLILTSELDIRKIKNPPLRSSCFYIETNVDNDSLTYHFKGAGWGHGVGMCQSGAIARANEGFGFKQILTHYFRGTKINEVFQ